RGPQYKGGRARAALGGAAKVTAVRMGGYLKRMLRPRLLATLMTPCIVTAACDGGLICTSEARPGISAIVRDSVTGAGLATGAVAVARERAFVDTLRGRDSVMRGAYERAGTYQLEVSRSGYQPWAKSGVRVAEGKCHVATTRLAVFLVPTSP